VNEEPEIVQRPQDGPPSFSSAYGDFEVSSGVYVYVCYPQPVAEADLGRLVGAVVLMDGVRRKVSGLIEINGMWALAFRQEIERDVPGRGASSR